MKKQNITLKEILYILFGNAGFAVAFNCFFTGNDIAAGGFGGLGLIISMWLPVSIGLIVFVISVPVFIWSYFVQGLKYTVSALLSTAAFSLLVDLFSFLPTLTENRLLAAICGGALYGFSSSILVRGYVSGSGTDLLARLLVTKFRHISLGSMVLICDGFVVALSVVAYGDIESGIYAAGALMIASYVMDTSIRGVNRAVIFQIITDGSADELADAIIKMDRGVTLLPAMGMYKRQEKNMLMVVVRPREIYAFKDLIRRISPGAFVMMVPANEVMGEGFKGIDVTVPVKNVKEEK
ncbi:MAG: YitT family protein [Oscillospiraceae bacterium]